MMAAPRLLAGLIPVPVMGIVAKWTKNTANPIGNGAKIWRWLYKLALNCDMIRTKHMNNLRYAITYRNMGVSGATLGIGGWEDGVDKDKGANNFSTKSRTLGVAMVDFVGAATI